MTREEALYKVKGYLTDIISAEDYSEVEEIIKALEQKPETVTEFADRCRECGAKYGKLLERTRWIPTSESQPKENGNYLAFYCMSDGTASLEFMMVDHCNAGGGWLHEEKGRKTYKKVTAWMQLPESYKVEKEDKEW